MIDRELEAEILRLYHAEKWPIETIAKQHGIHHSVVRRVLAQESAPRAQPRRRRKVDPYLPFLREMLEKYPRITASRLYDMARDRGFDGRPSQFRAVVAELRPSIAREAYLRLRTLPGEQAQVDWGHFGRIEIGRASRPLMAFVMVLSYSRAVFLRYYVSQTLGCFLRGHEAAFAWFQGVPRCCLYDNLKSVVLERAGKEIRFHDTFLEYAGVCRFKPKPVGVARGNEKGRVERAIRYVRDRFFEARRFADLDDLNDQARHWCETTALERSWPEDTRRTVGEVLEEERPRLMRLPEAPFACEDRVEVTAGKTPYVRFDWNDYSVPHEYVRRTLVVAASDTTVRVLDGPKVVATHERSLDRGLQIEDPSHIESLAAAKRAATRERTADVLTRVVPATADLLTKIAERQLSLRRATGELLELLRTHGAEALERAIHEALRNGTHHAQAVRHILERERLAAGRRPVLPLDLPNDPRVRDLIVQPHDLRHYEELGETDTNPDPEEDERK